LEEEILNHFCPIFKKFFKLNLFAWKRQVKIHLYIDRMENMQRELHCSRISPKYVKLEKGLNQQEPMWVEQSLTCKPRA
jgi:hypothetical protein